MKASSNKLFFLLISVASFFSLLVVDASDPDPLQDFCVSRNETEAGVFINGKICKDPMTVTADDFHFAGGLHTPHEILSPFGITITLALEAQLPGLNSQGLSLARVDYVPHGLNPPHTHPRATEVIVVLTGKLFAGFMTSDNGDGKNKLFAKILYPGDVYVFPRGLLHFQYNVGKKKAAAIVAFNSQNPGLVTVPAALLESEPPLSLEILAKSFRVDEELVEYLKSRLN